MKLHLLLVVPAELQIKEVLEAFHISNPIDRDLSLFRYNVTYWGLLTGPILDMRRPIDLKDAELSFLTNDFE